VTTLYRGFLGPDRSPELFGKCSYLHGDVYVGEWSGGQPHGFGKCMFKDGKIYEGGWKTGGYHGKGKYTNADGTTYEGEWRDDKRHGNGKFKDRDGIEYVEVYKDGELKHRHVRGGDGAGGGGGGAGVGGKKSTWTMRERQEAERKIRETLQVRYEAKWKKFETNPPETIDHDDIPWPPPGNLLDADDGKSAAEIKRRCKEFIMRWHPDKWLGKPLAEHERDRIMEDVTSVFRRVDAEKQKAGL
jgi:hypothetical protein